MPFADAAVAQIADGDELEPDLRSSSATVLLAAAVKASAVVFSGLLLVSGLGLVVWAVTPSSGSGPLPLVRAGIAAFGSANGMTVMIGRSALTLPPLMLTVVAIALLTSISGRGRVRAGGPAQETGSVLTAATVYSAAVTVGSVWMAPPGMMSGSQWWRPWLLAFVVVGLTTLVRGDGWRTLLLDRLPVWAPVAFRLSGVGTAVMIGGGAVALLIGLARSFGAASSVMALSAPGLADGLGMVLLGIAYLPNAVIAGTGFAGGVGFTIGNGTYSPFGSTSVELPAVPLLTAVPANAGLSKPALLLLLVPVVAAVIIGRAAVARLDSRLDRILAAAVAAILTGAVLSLAAVVASGGITGGEWAHTGVAPGLLGGAVAVELGLIGAAVAAAARADAASAIGREDDTDAADDEEPQQHPAVAESGDDEPAGDDEPGDDEPAGDVEPGDDEPAGDVEPGDSRPPGDEPGEAEPEPTVPDGPDSNDTVLVGQDVLPEVEDVLPDVEDVLPEVEDILPDEDDIAPDGADGSTIGRGREEDLVAPRSADGISSPDEALVKGLARKPGRLAAG